MRVALPVCSRSAHRLAVGRPARGKLHHRRPGNRRRRFFSERRRQVNLVFLLVNQDAANQFGHRVLAEGFALANALAVIANRFNFVLRQRASLKQKIFAANPGTHIS